MSPQLESTLPEPGRLRVMDAPHWYAAPGVLPVTLTFLAAAGAAQLAGTVLFGWMSLRVLAIAVAVALLTQSCIHLLGGRGRTGSDAQALLTGVLFACTLPPTVPWHVTAIGAGLCILLGEALLGGIGNYLWHPIALARVVVQMLFAGELSRDWPVLAPGHLFSGDMWQSRRLPELATWGTQQVPDGVDAWLVTPAIEHLRAPAAAGSSPAEALVVLIRDLMPPWPDTLTGVAGGAIGEACGIALLVGGLILMWRGLLKPSFVFGAVLAAGIAAAALPIHVLGPTEAAAHWLPGVAVWEGWPIGLAYVCYQLTAGDLLFVLLVLAPDPSSSPLTSRGHLLFGILVGGLAMLFRVMTGIPAAAYWALLAANTLVPLIDRFTRRRVLGT